MNNFNRISEKQFKDLEQSLINYDFDTAKGVLAKKFAEYNERLCDFNKLNHDTTSVVEYLKLKQALQEDVEYFDFMKQKACQIYSLLWEKYLLSPQDVHSGKHHNTFAFLIKEWNPSEFQKETDTIRTTLFTENSSLPEQKLALIYPITESNLVSMSGANSLFCVPGEYDNLEILLEKNSCPSGVLLLDGASEYTQEDAVSLSRLFQIPLLEYSYNSVYALYVPGYSNRKVLFDIH